MTEQLESERVQPATEQATIGAIRLAVEASAEGKALRKVLTAILERAPETPAGDTASVALLIDAVRAANGEFLLTDHHPKGRLRPAPPEATPPNPS